MKFSTSQALMGVMPLAAAFPFKMMQELADNPELQARAANLIADKRQTSADAATAVFEAVPVFDAESQYIDVSEGSGHEWQAPGPDDIRGVCPGLNAMANHGFLPRSGYATIGQYINATTSVVGMGADLSAFLSILGGLIDSGDGLAWSMGGQPSAAIAGPVGALGKGLDGSHNKYENDVSPTRPDLYETGNNYITEASQFQDMIDASPGGVVTLDSLALYRSQRFDRQIANNPYFFNAPFPGLLVQPAAFTFIYRFMANHSAEDPVGTLSYKNVQSWFGIEGESGSYSAPFGYERIPDNWYRRSQVAPYSIPYFLGDVLNFARLHPKFISIGGNVNGQTNTFTGVDLGNLTGGLFHAGDLLEGNNLGCFAFQVATQVNTDLLGLGSVVDGLLDSLGDIINSLGCPQLSGINTDSLNQFAGYTKSPVFNSSKTTSLLGLNL